MKKFSLNFLLEEEKQLSFLTAISPIDGRYGKQLNKLREIFSECSLIKFRIYVEICWLKKLADCREIKEMHALTQEEKKRIESIFMNFNEEHARNIKIIEKKIKHDVKAIEFFIREQLRSLSIENTVIEFVHFACTSEDINNLSYAIMLKTTRKELILPIWKKIILVLMKLSKKYKRIPLLSRTHGQPATPSTIGKEIANIVYRLLRQYMQFQRIRILGKMNGTVGNYNAHLLAYPKINWHRFSKEFVEELGIEWNPYTTQIEPHDYIVELFNCISRFNSILIDFNRDMWGYISLGYFRKFYKKEEIGSSTMPHKINPIDFENSEGNLGIANSLINYISNQLPVSRWQRDLTDSTTLRNLGSIFGYSLIAYQALIRGLNKIRLDESILFSELDNHWEILSEPIQTVMRKYGIKNSYERVKYFSRGKKNNRRKIKEFIEKLQLPEKEKERLKKLTPFNYVGLAENLVDEILKIGDSYFLDS